MASVETHATLHFSTTFFHFYVSPRLSRFSNISPFLFKNRAQEILVYRQCMEGGHGLMTTHGEKAQTSKFSTCFFLFSVSVVVLLRRWKYTKLTLNSNPDDSAGMLCNWLRSEGSILFTDLREKLDVSKCVALSFIHPEGNVFFSISSRRFRRVSSDQIRTLPGR